MKRIIALLIFFILLLSFTACSPKQETVQNTKETVQDTKEAVQDTKETVQDTKETVKDTKETVKHTQFYIVVGETTFMADFADNSSADAFRELLVQGDLTINMSDYGSFEKVGSIGQRLPREDTQISTTTGDVILYQGNQIVIFYGTNNWSYSRLGKIQNATKDDLLTAFGSGNVTITFSLTK